ncbi:/ / putative rRNA maturation factor / 377475:377945 Reverse [Candidatus Hepatoplasma crinochetorum]|uniref:Endoribonuclease YbeY n=1 Tax=Candidatus Hepatoplasma crinochetorum TaxID=295596 RepID=A0A0G7ZL23_9MOLU|nr:/ / putative rRNA maturation factor / 377475:377945 Reverse [Candidatus Hepatoplasma crinochetorum]
MDDFKNLEITFFNNVLNKKILFKKNKEKLYQLLNEITKELNLKNQFVVSLNIVKGKKMQILNYKYRNVDKTTDVLSFPQNELFANIYDLGDIFINGELLEEQAKSIGSDQDTEFLFLFMHGLLHLIGYDHINIEDEKKMINRQKEIFKKLKIR